MESSVQIVVNGISMNVSTPLHVQDCFGPRPATDTPVLLYDITACKQQMKALNRRWVQLRVACARASQSLEVLRPEVERCRSRVRRHQMDQADLDKVREEVDQIMKARATAWRELRELRKARRAPGVLLLPHPEHGTVMVLDSHHYQLVRFVGEELILVGLQGGNRAMADAGSSEEVPEEEEQEGGALMEEAVATECRAVELFLRHRNKEVSEADFFRLAPEEQADFMQVARNLRRKERVNRGEVRGRFGDD